MSELTHEELTRLLDYDPETGVFRWKVDRPRGVKAGHVAGSKGNSGNIVMINSKLYQTRRLAWFIVTGNPPKNNLFSKNGDIYDEKFDNIGILPTKPKTLTHKYLRECIDYNPKTGEFKWKVSQATNRYGEDAFSISRKHGNQIVLTTGILGEKHATLRLIVFWMTGEMASKARDVMTIDNNNLNLKWNNIKIGSRSNTVSKSISRGRVASKGVSYDKHNKKFRSHISIDGKSISLGTFPTEAEAHAAYMKAARKHYGELANDGYQHAMYEMEYEEVELPVEPVPEPEPEPVVEEKIEPVIQHSDDF